MQLASFLYQNQPSLPFRIHQDSVQYVSRVLVTVGGKISRTLEKHGNLVPFVSLAGWRVELPNACHWIAHAVA